MKIYTTNEFLNQSLDALLWGFFNLKEDNNYFEISSQYKNTKYINFCIDNQTRKNNNKLINDYTGLEFELEKTSHILLINKSGKIIDDFLDLIYKEIQRRRFQCSDKEFDKAVIMAAFIPRGSFDFKLGLCAVDILRSISTDKYINNLFQLLVSTESLNQLNLNFRELQDQYVNECNKRNTQLRINLRWLYDKYSEEIKKINLYKYQILNCNKEKILQKNIRTDVNDSFIERIIFYKNKILSKNYKGYLNIDKSDIEKFRKDLKFTFNEDNIPKNKRNRDIVNIASIIHNDKCVCCCDKYDIKDRSFKKKNSRWYLEIHHVISFSSNQSGDVLDNLVKVCPTCHRALSPGRADESYQKELIKNILKNSNNANNFVANFIDSDNIEDKVDYIFNNLR